MELPIRRSTWGLDAGTHDVVTRAAKIVRTFADAGPGLSPDPIVAKVVVQAEQTCHRFSAVGAMHALTSVDGSTDVQRYYRTGHLARGHGSSAVRATLVPPS